MKMIETYRYFLFDLYGTLVDIRTDEQSDSFWNKVALLFERGDVHTIGTRYFSLCRSEALPEGGEIDLLRVFERLSEEFGGKDTALTTAKAFRAASVCKLRLFDGAAEILRGLRSRGAKLFLLSNAQACFTRYELEKLLLAPMFDGILLSSEVGWKKPSKQFFQSAMQRFSLSPEACVYVGNDLFDDVAGARSVGMRSVYIPTEQSGSYRAEIAPDLFARNHRELAEILFRLAGKNHD